MSACLRPKPIGSGTLQRLSLGLIAMTIVIALVAFCGWQWDVPVLRQFAPGLPAMNPASALSFLLASFSFLILAFPFRAPKAVGYFLAAVVLAIAVIRLSGYLVPVLAGVDQFLYTSRLKGDVAGSFPGRMAFTTALCFGCWAIALLLLRTPAGIHRAVQPLALVMGGIGLLSVIGYIYQVREFRGILHYLPMALNTSACFLCAAFALLSATPDSGFMKDLTTGGVGSVTARRLLPFAFLAPVVLGWLRLLSARIGAFTVEFGVSILVVSIIICFVSVIWHNARLLNRRDESRLKAREELSASERTFGLLIGNIRDYAIFMVDRAGRIKSWNPGAQAIKGYTAEEAIGQPISIFYTPEELERNEPAYNLKMAEMHGTYRGEGWRVRKNGSRFWADIVFTALYNSEHQLQGFAKITRDRSEQKHSADLIRHQAQLMEDISDAIISTDWDFRVVSWNKAAEKLFGFSLMEAKGIEMGELLRSPIDPSMQQAIRELLHERGYWYGEMLYYTKKNVALNVLISASATRDEENAMTGYVIVCRDITERLRAEQRLIKFNEELFRQVEEKTAEIRAIFERVTDGFMAFDPEGKIVYSNRKAAEIMGPDTARVGTNIFDQYFVANSEFKQVFLMALETQKDQHAEVSSPALDSWLETHLYPSPAGISLFFRDVTREKKVKEQLSQSSADLRALASHLQD
ncbi:MAG TPA: PAS domain S-box protein, partial [Puia sp.]|nr:PAS domain S-box protein [Puia sp.]